MVKASARIIIVAAALALAVTSGLAAPRQPERPLRPGLYDDLLVSETVGPAGAKADTIVIYQADFQDANGAPSPDGWTSVDRTVPPPSRWHVDTFYCENLDPLTVPNHAWWCGASTYATCQDGYGYGNGYDERLDWWGDVPDPAAGVNVVLTAKLNHDIEPGYDYLYLQVERATGMADLRTWNGVGTGLSVSEAFVVPVADFVDNPVGGAKAVHLRWQASSDGGWSDQDCLRPSSGHSQLDLIRVTFDQGGGPVQIGPVEDGEGPGGWRTDTRGGVGDFAKVWPLLSDVDPCRQNGTPQFAFIDDGVVVPGTGGSACISFCYGPGNYVLNSTGGLLGAGYYLDNEIWSPVIDYPAGHPGCWVQYDVFQHAPLLNFATDPGIGFKHHVRSINDNAENPIWSGWRSDDPFGYYSDSPVYYRRTAGATGWLVSGATRIQVSLGVHQVGYLWGYAGHDATPAPYYDNVRVVAFTIDGPSLVSGEHALAQDSFPACGFLDYANLGGNSVRFDMARDIGVMGDMFNDPGDSLTVLVNYLRPGSALAGPPAMVYKLKPNPLFDPYRTSGAPNAGEVTGIQYPRISNQYSFDLPDSNFFFPGDVIHYFFKATDTLGGTAFLPGDTTGFSLFPGDPGYRALQWSNSYVARALPTMRSAAPGDQPRKLFWNDADSGGEQEWLQALHACGYDEGAGLDVYYTKAPSSGVGNGLGGRATAAQLAGYDAILYSSGQISEYTINAVSYLDFNDDPGHDVGVLDAWLRQGHKGLFLSGDNLVYNLDNTDGTAGAEMLEFENTWIQVAYVAPDVRSLIGDQSSPSVRPLPAAPPVFVSATAWIAAGSCLRNYASPRFDAVTVQGSAVRLAEFLSASCGTGVYGYAAAVQTINPAYNANVIYLPYDLRRVVEDSDCGGGTPSPYGARAQLLRDVLLEFENPVGNPVAGVPGGVAFSAAVSPNPFNPRTTVRAAMPGPGKLTVEIYDVRGRLVRTLHDGEIEAGTHEFAWLGEGAGGEAASGVYFVRVNSPFGERTLKTALIR